MASRPVLPDPTLCTTRLCYDDLWSCLVVSAPDCPYRETYGNERFCAAPDAQRYRNHGNLVSPRGISSRSLPCL